ncbi:hypothetical protein Poly59_00120 [Rubripirellula reticaptiva]|uniref:Uncharacterized protein n=1 Tax=Rubripirellula reticaptiva TaxID=2528013 RepID=A0A5C6F9I3_9BACT|nr:hypothetical protein Poly59_00120 [Rubripirellula reticaptiva]
MVIGSPPVTASWLESKAMMRTNNHMMDFGMGDQSSGEFGYRWFASYE